MPSEFLNWASEMPGLLGREYDNRQHPKPIDVDINIDDRRKIHFRGNEKNPPQNINAKDRILGSEETKVDGLLPSNSNDYQ